MNRSELTHAIRRHAIEELGFDLVGFAPVERMETEGARLKDWLLQGYHGSMKWMEHDSSRRSDPRQLLPSAQSMIVLAKNYYTPHEHSLDPEHAKISRYAWGRDYHRILPKKLRKLHRFILTLAPEAENRWYVDTGPVMEKAWAVRAGIGWIGKHTNVITRSHGSWLFLGTMISSLQLEHGDPLPDFCGTCNRCVDACPTDAISAPYLLDATRCISYITIEQQPKKELQPEFAEKFEGWVFGCDICQDVCPWNKFQQPTDEEDFEPRDGRLDLTLDGLLAMNDREFEEHFRGSPVMRAKAEGMRRNAMGVQRAKQIAKSRGL